MRILVIKPKHIGDSLILTPTLVALRRARPDAKIWVVVRDGCQGILAGCPEIDRLFTVAAVDPHERRRGDFWRGLGLVLRLLAVKFDLVLELGDGYRGRLLALLCRARRRYSVKPAGSFKAWERRRFTAVSSFDWELRHRVEKDFRSVAEFFPLPEPIPPLRFDCARTRAWPPADGLADFAVIQIGKRQARGRWHREGWEEVGRWLLGRFNAVVIASGPASPEADDAAWLRERLGPRARATLGEADWAQMAGLLYRARLYIGLDTAMMHLAAACGCPVVALFGSSYEGNWYPWRVPHRIVAGFPFTPAGPREEDFEALKGRSMAAITPAAVIAACDELLAETAPAPSTS